MRVEVKKFGEILVSRPAGREALLAAKAYLLSSVAVGEPIELDFSGVKVMGPSWADEFVGGLRREYGSRIVPLPCHNDSVKESLKMLE